MSATPEQIAERLVNTGEWKAIIEKHRRKTDDPAITYVLKDGTRVHEDESSVAKLAASLSRALEDAATIAAEAASLIRAQSERVRVLVAEVARLSQPEWFGDWEEGECTFGSISDAAGDISGNEVRRVIGCRETGHLWITHRALSLDEDGEPDDFEVADFDNEAEAVKCWDESVAALRAALKAAL